MSLPLYGIDKELAEKQASKYDTKREQEAKDWIEQLLQERIFQDNKEFMDVLKDGVILCKLYNKAVPAAQIKINAGTSMPFKQVIHYTLH
jgi:transgelin